MGVHTFPKGICPKVNWSMNSRTTIPQSIALTITPPGHPPTGQRDDREKTNNHIVSPICLIGRMFANGSGNGRSIPGRVIPKTEKMVHDAT